MLLNFYYLLCCNLQQKSNRVEYKHYEMCMELGFLSSRSLSTACLISSLAVLRERLLCILSGSPWIFLKAE